MKNDMKKLGRVGAFEKARPRRGELKGVKYQQL